MALRAVPLRDEAEPTAPVVEPVKKLKAVRMSGDAAKRPDSAGDLRAVSPSDMRERKQAEVERKAKVEEIINRPMPKPGIFETVGSAIPGGKAEPAPQPVLPPVSFAKQRIDLQKRADQPARPVTLNPKLPASPLPPTAPDAIDDEIAHHRSQLFGGDIDWKALRDSNYKDYVEKTTQVINAANAARVDRGDKGDIANPVVRDLATYAEADRLGVPVTYKYENAETGEGSDSRPPRPVDPRVGGVPYPKAVEFYEKKKAEYDRWVEGTNSPIPISKIESAVSEGIRGERRDAEREDRGGLGRVAHAAKSFGVAAKSTATTDLYEGLSVLATKAENTIRGMVGADRVDHETNDLIYSLLDKGLGNSEQRAKLAADPLSGGWEDMLANGAGSTVGFASTGWLSSGVKLGSFLAPAITGAAVQTQSVYNEAIRFGASPEDAEKVVLLSALAGSSEALPITRAFGRFDKAYDIAKGADRVTKGAFFKTIIAHGVGEGFEEALQETVQAGVSNIAIAKYIDENRSVFQGMLEGAEVGGAVGMMMGVLFSAAGFRRADFSTPENTQAAFDLVSDIAGQPETLADEAGETPQPDQPQPTPPAPDPVAPPEPTGDAQPAPAESPGEGVAEETTTREDDAEDVAARESMRQALKETIEKQNQTQEATTDAQEEEAGQDDDGDGPRVQAEQEEVTEEEGVREEGREEEVDIGSMADLVSQGKRSRSSIQKEHGKDVAAAVREELSRRQESSRLTQEQMEAQSAEDRASIRDAIAANPGDDTLTAVGRDGQPFSDHFGAGWVEMSQDDRNSVILEDGELAESERIEGLTPRQRVEENVGGVRDDAIVTSEDIELAAKNAGWDVDTTTSASSEAHYVTISKGEQEYKIRVAGHQGGGVGKRLGGFRDPDIVVRLDNPGWRSDALGEIDDLLGSDLSGKKNAPTKTVPGRVPRGAEPSASEEDGASDSIASSSQDTKPEPPAKATEPAPKQPWEMGKDEFVSSQKKEALRGANKKYFASRSEDSMRGWEGNQGLAHRAVVEQAINRGDIDSHPDYPELGKKSPPAAQAKATGNKSSRDSLQAPTHRLVDKSGETISEHLTENAAKSANSRAGGVHRVEAIGGDGSVESASKPKAVVKKSLTTPAPPELTSRSDYVRLASTAQVRSVNRKTGQLEAVEIPGEKVSSALREELKTRSWLKKLRDCVGGK